LVLKGATNRTRSRILLRHDRRLVLDDREALGGAVGVRAGEEMMVTGIRCELRSPAIFPRSEVVRRRRAVDAVRARLAIYVERLDGADLGAVRLAVAAVGGDLGRRAEEELDRTDTDVRAVAHGHVVVL